MQVSGSKTTWNGGGLAGKGELTTTKGGAHSYSQFTWSKLIPWRVSNYIEAVVTRGKESVKLYYKALLKVRANPMRNHESYWSTCTVKIRLAETKGNVCFYGLVLMKVAKCLVI